MNPALKEVINNLSVLNTAYHGTVVPLSYTRVNTFMTCPKKFFYNYMCAIPKEKKKLLKTDANIAGSIIHNQMERYLQYYKFNSNVEYKDYDLCWVETLYYWESKKGGIPTSAMELVEQFRYPAEKVVEELAQMITNHKFLAMPEFAFVYYPDGTIRKVNKYPNEDPHFFFYGAVDLLLMTQSRTQALIIDYKTYGEKVDGDKPQSFQLDLYKYFLYEWFSKKYKMSKISTAIAYIPDSLLKRFGDFLSPNNIAETEQEITSFFEKYQNALEDNAKYLKKMNFPKQPGKHCSYCDYYTFCKGKDKAKKEQPPLRWS